MKTILQLSCPAYILISFLLYDWQPEYSGDTTLAASRDFFVKNNSNQTIYYKPESRISNDGIDPDGAYPIAPGESLKYPVDGLITPGMKEGEIYKVPTGSTITIDENGEPQPSNMIALAILLRKGDYGKVKAPDPNFAKLANIKMILNQPSDITLNR